MRGTYEYYNQSLQKSQYKIIDIYGHEYLVNEPMEWNTTGGDQYFDSYSHRWENFASIGNRNITNVETFDLTNAFLYRLNFILDDIVEERGEGYSNFLKKLTNRKSQLEERLNRINKKKEGRLSWSKRGRVYILKLDFPDFLLRKKLEIGEAEKEEYERYLFKGISVELALRKTKEGITIKEAARATRYYNHPFIYPPEEDDDENKPMKICYGHGNNLKRRFKDHGIVFPFKISSNKIHEEQYSESILHILKEAENVIKYGYRGKFIPVKKLNQENFSNEFIRYEPEGVEIIDVWRE